MVSSSSLTLILAPRAIKSFEKSFEKSFAAVRQWRARDFVPAQKSHGLMALTVDGWCARTRGMARDARRNGEREERLFDDSVISDDSIHGGCGLSTT